MPAPQDVDLLVVGDVDVDRVYAAAQLAEAQLGSAVDATVLSHHEWEGPRHGIRGRRARGAAHPGRSGVTISELVRDGLASGLRATVRPRAHEAVGLYALDALADAAGRDSIEYFDRMRSKRNRSEYGVRTFGAAEVERDLRHAGAIVDAVERDLACT